VTGPDHGFAHDLKRAAHAVSAAGELALACHVTPDGDALGSLLGLHHLAANAGMPTVMSWPEPFHVAHRYRSLPGREAAIPPSAFPADPLCMLTFDCGSMGRLNELGAPAKSAAGSGELIVIDHHASNTRYGTINVVDPSAAATAVVVRQLARELDWPLTREAAWCLYVGLVADTGRFQYGSTNASVFALAQELASFDLPVATISRELSEEHRFAFLKLAAAAISRAELDVEHSFVSTFVTQDDLLAFNVSYEEAEGLIDWIRTTSEAEVSCVCKEAHNGVRVSLRSLSRIDVGAIAVSLGGGGHRLAAGFTMDAPIAEVLSEVRRRLPSATV
jgi:bifunctional oligoribonuclease and PAP phosphatase NrnA